MKMEYNIEVQDNKVRLEQWYGKEKLWLVAAHFSIEDTRQLIKLLQEAVVDLEGN